jgi:hypothetical protein
VAGFLHDALLPVQRGGGTLLLSWSPRQTARSQPEYETITPTAIVPEENVQDQRTAAYIVAIDKVAQSYLELGVFP